MRATIPQAYPQQRLAAAATGNTTLKSSGSILRSTTIGLQRITAAFSYIYWHRLRQQQQQLVEPFHNSIQQ